jgi:DNA polymerase-1
MRIVFFDAYNLIHRARHSTPDYLKDTPDGMIFTFFRSLAALWRTVQPDEAYFVIEGTPYRRLALLPEYKATRVKGPDDGFARQKNEIIDLLSSSFPVSVVQHLNYEADDVIAHLVIENAETTPGAELMVVSTDTDFLQLANTPHNFVQYDPIKKKNKELPEFDYVQWKSLRGDSSDNIPGFKGIGDKRAHKLLESEESLEKFLAIEDNRSLFERNIELISFHDLTHCRREIKYSLAYPDWENVHRVFTAKSFSSIVKEGSWEKFVKSFQRGGN